MNRRRQGIVLVVVLIVVTMLALGSLTFADWMLDERLAAQDHHPPIAGQGLRRDRVREGQDLPRSLSGCPADGRRPV